MHNLRCACAIKVDIINLPRIVIVVNKICPQVITTVSVYALMDILGQSYIYSPVQSCIVEYPLFIEKINLINDLLEKY